MQALGQQMMRRLQGFAAMSHMKRLALLLLARTFTDKDVIRLKVWFVVWCTAALSCTAPDTAMHRGQQESVGYQLCF